ncbi:signal recognition particle protein, partial [Pseudoalteromonas carrageenovora]
DVLSLIEEVEMKVDIEQAAKVAEIVFKGAGFSLDDFADQLKQMKNMCGMMSMLDKLPGMANLPYAVKGQMGDKT